jgi:hypothetical protein
MAEEIFLNSTLPGFEAEEKRVKEEGFVEKKYTRSTHAEIEGALKRFLLKQIVPQRGLTKPEQINALEPELRELVKSLYIDTPSGKYFKIKMYVPTEKLRRARENALMREEIKAEEEFVPNNYGQMVELTEKAEEVAEAAFVAVRGLTAQSNIRYIKGAIDKTQRAKLRLIGILGKLHKFPLMAARVQQLINGLTMAEAHAIGIHREYTKEWNELADMMLKTNFGTHYQWGPEGLVERPEYKSVNTHLTKYWNEKYGVKWGGQTLRRRHTKRRHTKRRHTKRRHTKRRHTRRR